MEPATCQKESSVDQDNTSASDLSIDEVLLYNGLVKQFHDYQQLKETLERLGHLEVIGPVQCEVGLTNVIGELEFVLLQQDQHDVGVSLPQLEARLRELRTLIERGNRTLTPYELRLYISRGALNRHELLSLAKFLVSLQSDAADDRSKMELLCAELCKGLSKEDKEQLLNELLPRAQPLTCTTIAIIDEMLKLEGVIEAAIEFPQLIEGGYLEQARLLKGELAEVFWQPLTLAAVNSLNLSLRTTFKKLFEAERYFILSVCRELLDDQVTYLKWSNDVPPLDVKAAEKLTAEAEHLLTENYLTNIGTLRQIAGLGRWMRFAVDNRQGGPAQSRRAAVDSASPASRGQGEAGLEPISIAAKQINSSALEEQLDARIEELSHQIATQQRHDTIEALHLKHTTLLLEPLEIQAILSLGNLVDCTARLRLYKLVRRAAALLAELQESAFMLAEGAKQKRSKYYYSLPAIKYFVAQAQLMQGELEVVSQQARQNGDMALALNLAGLRTKLQQLCLSNLNYLKKFYPQID